VNGAALDRVFREASGRIIAALVTRFRDLSIAEDAFSESCLRAVRTWSERGVPRDPAAWLFRVGERVALDFLRRKRVREHNSPEMPAAEQTAEDLMLDGSYVIPDERLRLIFICCHPAVAPEARAALTLRLVCGLTVTEIARAFLIHEATLSQRLVRAKRKIAEAGIPFELPSPESWAERMEAVLSTIEISYAKAHEDASGTGSHAGFAAEMLHLTRLLTDLVPQVGDAFALAALIRYAEARRPSRADGEGIMVPLAEQDPRLWRHDLIAGADTMLVQAARLAPTTSRTLQAQLQRVWCTRRGLTDPAPWPAVLSLYDRLLELRNDPIIRLNRAVALAEVEGPVAALSEVDALVSSTFENFLPYHAVRADLLARTGQLDAARAAYRKALAFEPSIAERRWLERKAAVLASEGKNAGR
jgi:RNA polymerase sigma-70 factor (ECF subfamily)